jgi:hypothetical protein
MDKPLNVATPLTALTVVVPPRVPLLGLVPIASDTDAELLATFPFASSIVTTGCCAKGVDATELALGCVVKSSFVAAPGLTV